MTLQEPTPKNKQKPTPEADEPHYVVITGTNIRSTLPGKDFTPKVYDSEAIAFAAIDAETTHRKRMTARAITPRSPISAAEYDWKYSAYQNVPKE